MLKRRGIDLAGIDAPAFDAAAAAAAALGEGNAKISPSNQKQYLVCDRLSDATARYSVSHREGEETAR